MDKGDTCAPAPGAGRLVDETGALLLEMSQRRFDGGDHERDMMQTLAPGLQESAHGSVRPQWLQQLDERPPDRDHRLFHALGLDDLPIQRLHAISSQIAGKCGVQVVDRDADVVQVEQFHDREAIGPDR